MIHLAITLLCAGLGQSGDGWPADPLHPNPRIVQDAGKQLLSPILPKDQLPDRRYDAILKEPISVDARGLPLNALLKQIAERFRINILLNRQSLNTVMVKLDTPITLTVANVPLESVLELILEPLELLARPEHEAIHIVDRQEIGQEQYIGYYPIVDLAYIVQGSFLQPIDHLWVELIQSIVSPDSWVANGGMGTIEFDPLTGTFVVEQSQAEHKRIEDLLSALRLAKQRAARVVDLQNAGPLEKIYQDQKRLFAELQYHRRSYEWEKLPSQPVYTIPITDNHALRQRGLNRRIPTIDFRGQTIHQALTAISQASGIPIVLDPSAFPQQNRLLQFDASLVNLTLGSALHWVLESAGLRRVHPLKVDGAVHIADLEHFDDSLFTVDYPVADLVLVQLGTKTVLAGNHLCEHITNTAWADTWELNAGMGEIRFNRNSASLRVRQTVDGHHVVRHRLELLRDAKSRSRLLAVAAGLPPLEDLIAASFRQEVRWEPIADGESSPVRDVKSLVRSIDLDPQRSESFERIYLATMNQSVTLDVEMVPLHEVVRLLNSQLIQTSDGSTSQPLLLLDQVGLDITQLHPSYRVTARLGQTTLGRALEAILAPRGLMTVPRHHCLLITDEEETGQHIWTRIYPIADLLVARDVNIPERALQVRNEIFLRIEEDSWEDNGGWGSVVYDPVTLSLVVSQSTKVHEGIIAYLNRRREKLR